MLNYETLLSNYDDKLTLMQWLKKVEDALKDASAVSFDAVNLGNATFKFKIVFEDGSEIESDPLIINKGDSVASAAIVNGDLILTLTNGDTIDAGNMFDGNVNITGTLDVGNDVDINGDVAVTGDVSVTGEVASATASISGGISAGSATISGNASVGGDVTATGDVNADGVYGNEIVENMSGYSFSSTATNLNIAYAGVVKNGNKITFAVSGTITKSTTFSTELGTFVAPSTILAKLYNNVLGDLSEKGLYVSSSKFALGVNLATTTQKTTTQLRVYIYATDSLTDSTDYAFRYEETFLLSDNLAA